MTDWDEHAQDLLSRGTTAWQRRRYDEAVSAFHALMANYPERPEGYNKMGVVCADTGKREQAETYFRQALSRDAMHVPSLTNLANIELENGNVSDAIHLYHRALEADPTYPPAHRNLAIAYRKMGRLSASVHHLRQAETPSRHRNRALPSFSARPGQRRVPLWVWFVFILSILFIFNIKAHL